MNADETDIHPICTSNKEVHNKIGPTHGTGYVAHITLDLCVTSSKESVCDSVCEKGKECEPVPSESSEECVTDAPGCAKNNGKMALSNADPHLGPAHETTGSL